MSPVIYKFFERLCADLRITGSVLEIGASPFHKNLLSLAALRNASLRIGVGLDGAYEDEEYSILHQNAHDLSCFKDHTFELVMSNSMLEHDPSFWKTTSEAYRVLAPGGWMIIGVPGFGAMDSVPSRDLILAALQAAEQTPDQLRAIEVSSLTLGIHNYPGDYYRFSPQAMKEVLLQGLSQVQIFSVMQPPRIVGMGRKV